MSLQKLLNYLKNKLNEPGKNPTQSTAGNVSSEMTLKELSRK
jgi:hypothetical protein